MRVADEEGVYIEAVVPVAIKATSQIFGNVRGIVVFIVRRAADIHVDEDRLVIVEAKQDHVSVGDGKEGDRGSHSGSQVWIVLWGTEHGCPANICRHAQSAVVGTRKAPLRRR